jgi:hypothetical protein
MLQDLRFQIWDSGFGSIKRIGNLSLHLHYGSLQNLIPVRLSAQFRSQYNSLDLHSWIMQFKLEENLKTSMSVSLNHTLLVHFSLNPNFQGKFLVSQRSFLEKQGFRVIPLFQSWALCVLLHKFNHQRRYSQSKWNSYPFSSRARNDLLLFQSLSK